MSVRFEFGTIIRYAFSDNEELVPDYLISDKQIVEFIRVLDDEIRSHANVSTVYKYVVFDWDDSVVNEWLDSHRDYIVIGGVDYILLSDEWVKGADEQIEEHYCDPVVTAALRKARASIRLKKSEVQ